MMNTEEIIITILNKDDISLHDYSEFYSENSERIKEIVEALLKEKLPAININDNSVIFPGLHNDNIVEVFENSHLFLQQTSLQIDTDDESVIVYDKPNVDQSLIDMMAILYHMINDKNSLMIDKALYFQALLETSFGEYETSLEYLEKIEERNNETVLLLTAKNYMYLYDYEKARDVLINANKTEIINLHVLNICQVILIFHLNI